MSVWSFWKLCDPLELLHQPLEKSEVYEAHRFPVVPPPRSGQTGCMWHSGMSKVTHDCGVKYEQVGGNGI